jgi:hypothetical protein
MPLTYRDIETIRHGRGRSLLLFITDRCPVGCAHCCVDSRSDGGTIADFELFTEIVGWIARAPELELVTISGGEPFVERRGLDLATRRIAAARKQVVIYTSGSWASRTHVPGWIHDVLGRCASVVLSTDSFHSAALADDCLVRAAREIAAAGSWIIMQALDEDGARERAGELLCEAFGGRWDQFAEVNLVAPLAHGRGNGLFQPLARSEGRSFGPCASVLTPTIRYDGVVSACGNDSVVIGRGPTRLRRQADSADDLDAAVAHFEADSLLRVIGNLSVGALTEHPRLVELAQERFASNCDLCWKAFERLPEDDRLVETMADRAAKEASNG